MGKASRRKRQQRNADHRERVQAAGSVPAPNFEGAAVEATRHALAMVTAIHASPEDLPSLTEDLVANRAMQGLVAYALLSQLIMESARELADARGATLAEALNEVFSATFTRAACARIASEQGLRVRWGLSHWGSR
jgi:hypothetical protein